MKILWLQTLKPMEMALSSFNYRQLGKPKQVFINFGCFKKSMKVLVKDDLPDTEICLSVNLSDIYTIPTNLPYEVIIKNNQINIGPVIGNIVIGSFEELDQETFSFVLPRLIDYEAIKGLVFICTKDSIHIDSGMIEGYYFDPQGREGEKFWKYGRFPLPNAIFNRSYISENKIRRIQEKIGDTFFNSYWENFDKWLFWQRLSSDERAKAHLPYTEKYSSIEQLLKLLAKYNTVYLKPRTKSQGRGVMKVTKTKQGILVENNNLKKYSLENTEAINQFFSRKLVIPYIIQQAVPFKVNGKQIDFRLNLQKDGSMNWSCSGIMARISLSGGIITNFEGRSGTISGREALQAIYNLERDKIQQVETEMTRLIIRAIGVYEKMGLHFGDIAADIIVDSNLKLWLLELQSNYGIDGDTEPDLFDLYIKIMKTPLQYAKALAGFAPSEKG